MTPTTAATVTSPAATFAVVVLVLFVAHQVGDHWGQTSHQAATKGAPTWAGRWACTRHVLTLTAIQAGALAVVSWALGLHLHPAAVAAGLAVNGASHWWADRRHTLRHLAELAGRAEFYSFGAPRAGKNDNPSLGTGSYALDQSWHLAWLIPSALIITLWLAPTITTTGGYA